MQKEPEVIFAQLKYNNEPIVVESMCVNCQENGQTTMLLTSIPFFRQIIVISFNCDNCGYKNNEIQFGGKLGENGVNIAFKLTIAKDLNRELVKSEHAKITIPELDFEIPANKKAQVTTIEGLFVRCIEDLQGDQPLRKIMDPPTYQKIEAFIERLGAFQRGQHLPFNLLLEDPSGNSFIKNPYAPKIDHNLHYTFFKRSNEDVTTMGYSVQNTKQELTNIQQHRKDVEYKGAHKIDYTEPFNQQNFAKTEGLVFNVPCHSCGLPGQTRMCQTNIPYFKDLIIMSFSCDYCGAHSTETKTSGEVKPLGTLITLKKPTAQDLKRDVFKSDTCAVQIPELQLQLDYGTLGGVFTTVQGLIEKITDHLTQNNPFCDSDKEFSERMDLLILNLTQCRNGQKDFTLILNDPLGHSFLQNPSYPDIDPNVTVKQYQRTQDQNEFLGLLDMKVQGYQTKQ